ncbi:hypothetical protein ACCF68_003992 [Vibrio parahaemolyticus]
MSVKFRIGYTYNGKTKLFTPAYDDAINSVSNPELKYHLETARRLSTYTDAGLESMMPKEAMQSLIFSESKLAELAHSLDSKDWGVFQAWRTSLLKQQH